MKEKNQLNILIPVFNEDETIVQTLENILSTVKCNYKILICYDYDQDPTLKIIRFTKKIAIANKESIICGWSLIKKNINRYKTKFIPVDSEHFSIWSLLNNVKSKNIEKIFITASGGPFRKYPVNKFKNIKPKQALKHPNWSMGRKISIDMCTEGIFAWWCQYPFQVFSPSSR